ncbi:S41 family peptidase [Methylobacterium sp. Leaf111]|uniref:S41 family peptidase n=1 Tax=Methylobacterium sp. Leaf111 TaxID=1736257 RepID=UPI0009ECC47E|nr:S41 family peptidase [Methylobacterium sp. Leaf111]
MPGPNDAQPARRAIPRRVRHRSRWLAGLAGVAAALLACTASPDARRGTGERTGDTPGGLYEALSVFGAAFHAIRAKAAEERRDDQLVDAAISGMVASLDPYSGYVTAAELQAFDEEDTGTYAGIGVTVEAGGRVRSALPGAPAARAGLHAGTIIERIDGRAVHTIDRTGIVDLLRGDPGTAVHLRVRLSERQAATEVALTREWLPLHPVRTRLLGTVGYVGLDHFDDFTTGRLLKAVAGLQAHIGPEAITGLVLDLRGNPGGLVVQAVAVAGAFLGRGEIVRLVGRGPGDVERFALDRGGKDLVDGLPLVVLVDGDTASAAEIVAGALQDHRRATLVGTRTYGKGAVQTTYLHRSGRGLRLTTAWFVTPAGRRVQGRGIEPDLVVAQDGDVTTRDEEAVPTGHPDGDATSLQNGIVEDARIDPAGDAPLATALRHLGTVVESRAGRRPPGLDLPQGARIPAGRE